MKAGYTVTVATYFIWGTAMTKIIVSNYHHSNTILMNGWDDSEMPKSMLEDAVAIFHIKPKKQ